AWKAGALPAELHPQSFHLVSPGAWRSPSGILVVSLGSLRGLAVATVRGGRWIRTTEGISRQIYSLLPLAARASLQISVEARLSWSWRLDSNPRAPYYQSSALQVDLRLQD